MIYFLTRLHISQGMGVTMNIDDFRTSSLRKWAEMNAKLIRNAMFVTLVIVVISMMGRAHGLG